MFSGGIDLSDLDPRNYDYSPSYLPGSLWTIAETVLYDIPKKVTVDVPVAVADAVFVDAPVAMARGISYAARWTYGAYADVYGPNSKYPVLGKVLLVIPAAAAAVALGAEVLGAAAVAAAVTAVGKIGGALGLGALIFGGAAAANGGCVVHSGSATLQNGSGEFSYSANEACYNSEIAIFNDWQRMCESSGGHATVISNISEIGACYLRAWCDGGSVVAPQEPEQPQAEGGWCSPPESRRILQGNFPAFEVTGRCSHFMFQARTDAVLFLLGKAAAEWMTTRPEGLSCLSAAGIDGAAAFRNSGATVDIVFDTENSTDNPPPRATFTFTNGAAIQVDIAGARDSISCSNASAGHGNNITNIATCRADVSSAVFTCSQASPSHLPAPPPSYPTPPPTSGPGYPVPPPTNPTGIRPCSEYGPPSTCDVTNGTHVLCRGPLTREGEMVDSGILVEGELQKKALEWWKTTPDGMECFRRYEGNGGWDNDFALVLREDPTLGFGVRNLSRISYLTCYDAATGQTMVSSTSAVVDVSLLTYECTAWTAEEVQQQR